MPSPLPSTDVHTIVSSSSLGNFEPMLAHTWYDRSAGSSTTVVQGAVQFNRWWARGLPIVYTDTVIVHLRASGCTTDRCTATNNDDGGTNVVVRFWMSGGSTVPVAAAARLLGCTTWFAFGTSAIMSLQPNTIADSSDLSIANPSTSTTQYLRKTNRYIIKNW